MKADKIILGVLGGVAVGAALGVLFAPEKGDKTRRKIMDKSNDYADELKDKLDSLLGTVSNKYDKLKKEGENLFAEGKSRLQEARHDGQDLIAEGKSKFNEVKNEIKNS